MSNKKKAATAETVYIKSYSAFGGVDFTSSVTEIDDRRSPDAPNMISNQAGFPQKRTGYVTKKTYTGNINGIHTLNSGQDHILIHAGENLYKTDFETDTLLYGHMQDAKSVSFVHGGKLYILDGYNYMVYDGSTAKAVQGYTPTTVISATPTGGGKDYESINLISPKRINQFIGTAAATEYQLDAKNIDAIDKVEILNASNEWVETSAYICDLQTGVVTFASAPGVPVIEGADNIRITFAKINANPVIEKCTIFAFYGVGGDNRLFVSGNPAIKNRDWQSGSNDPTYFPDIQYTDIGGETCAIMGYMKQYGDLIIIKEPNDQDATVFVRSTAEDNDGKTIFPVAQGLAGVGAISKYAFGVLYDDNLFLSRDGVFSLESNRVSFQKTTQLRSYYINAKLTKEAGLQSAFSCVHDRYYMLFINNKVYLADAMQRNSNMSGSYGYEWFCWTDIPARCAKDINGVLYFGTSNGKVCMFKSVEEYDMAAYSDDGAAISAYWTTKKDALTDSSSYKKIKKRNIGVVAMPFANTSGKIFYIGDTEKQIKEYSLSSEFDFDNIDFDNFSFGEEEIPRFVPCNKKAKKIKMFQMRVENSNVNEAFGLYEIRFQYSIKRAIKR